VSIDLDTIRTTAVWGLVAIGVVGLVAAIVITKIVGKIIALVLAAVLIFLGWQQRQHVLEVASDVQGSVCAASTTFFGVDVAMPEAWCAPA
jgi:hypothetical protein